MTSTDCFMARTSAGPGRIGLYTFYQDVLRSGGGRKVESHIITQNSYLQNKKRIRNSVIYKGISKWIEVFCFDI